MDEETDHVESRATAEEPGPAAAAAAVEDMMQSSAEAGSCVAQEVVAAEQASTEGAGPAVVMRAQGDEGARRGLLRTMSSEETHTYLTSTHCVDEGSGEAGDDDQQSPHAGLVTPAEVATAAWHASADDMQSVLAAATKERGLLFEAGGESMHGYASAWGQGEQQQGSGQWGGEEEDALARRLPIDNSQQQHPSPPHQQPQPPHDGHLAQQQLHPHRTPSAQSISDEGGPHTGFSRGPPGAHSEAWDGARPGTREGARGRSVIHPAGATSVRLLLPDSDLEAGATTAAGDATADATAGATAGATAQHLAPVPPFGGRPGTAPLPAMSTDPYAVIGDRGAAAATTHIAATAAAAAVNRASTTSRLVYRPDNAYATPPAAVLRSHNGVGEGQLLYQIGKFGPLTPTYAPYWVKVRGTYWGTEGATTLRGRNRVGEGQLVYQIGKLGPVTLTCAPCWVKDPPQRPAVTDLRLSPSQRSTNCYSPEFLDLCLSPTSSRPSTAPLSPTGAPPATMASPRRGQRASPLRSRVPAPSQAAARIFARPPSPSAVRRPSSPRSLPPSPLAEYYRATAVSSFETGLKFVPRAELEAQAAQAAAAAHASAAAAARAAAHSQAAGTSGGSLGSPSRSLVKQASRMVLGSIVQSRVIDQGDARNASRHSHYPLPNEASVRASLVMSHEPAPPLPFKKTLAVRGGPKPAPGAAAGSGGAGAYSARGGGQLSPGAAAARGGAAFGARGGGGSGGRAGAALGAQSLWALNHGGSGGAFHSPLGTHSHF